MRNILWCIYWECVQAAGVSASCSGMAGAEPGGRGRLSPSPPPCWRLILLDTQAQQCGGGGVGGGGKGGGVSLVLFLKKFLTLRSFTTPRKREREKKKSAKSPTCRSSSLTKGTVSEPHWLFKCRIADFFFFFLSQTKLLIGTKIPRASRQTDGVRRSIGGALRQMKTEEEEEGKIRNLIVIVIVDVNKVLNLPQKKWKETMLGLNTGMVLQKFVNLEVFCKIPTLFSGNFKAVKLKPPLPVILESGKRSYFLDSVWILPSFINDLSRN